MKQPHINSVMTKQDGKLETSIMAIVIFIITLVTNFSKELFVEQSGNIQIFGNFGLLLVVGLIWKWKYIRNVVSIISLLSLFTIFMGVIVVKAMTIPFLMLFSGMAMVFYLSTFSNKVKVYMNEE